MRCSIDVATAVVAVLLAGCVGVADPQPASLCEIKPQVATHRGKEVALQARILRDGLHGMKIVGRECPSISLGVALPPPGKHPDVDAMMAAVYEPPIGTLYKNIDAIFRGELQTEGNGLSLVVEAISDLQVRRITFLDCKPSEANESTVLPKIHWSPSVKSAANGRVLLLIQVHRDGYLVGVDVAQPSGNSRLDEEARQTVLYSGARFEAGTINNSPTTMCFETAYPPSLKP